MLEGFGVGVCGSVDLILVKLLDILPPKVLTRCGKNPKKPQKTTPNPLFWGFFQPHVDGERDLDELIEFLGEKIAPCFGFMDDEIRISLYLFFFPPILFNSLR